MFGLTMRTPSSATGDDFPIENAKLVPADVWDDVEGETSPLFRGGGSAMGTRGEAWNEAVWRWNRASWEYYPGAGIAFANHLTGDPLWPEWWWAMIVAAKAKLKADLTACDPDGYTAAILLIKPYAQDIYYNNDGWIENKYNFLEDIPIEKIGTHWKSTKFYGSTYIPSPPQRSGLKGFYVTGAVVALISGPSVDKITVSPNPAPVPPGKTQEFEATAISFGPDRVEGTEDDEDVTDEVADYIGWSLTTIEIDPAAPSGTKIGTIPGPFLGETMMFTAGEYAGKGTITASVGGKSGSATIIVGGPQVDKIEVTPQSATLPLSGTQGFDATAFDKDGNDITGDVADQIEWALSTTDIGTIPPDVKDSSITFTATSNPQNVGEGAITASVASKSDSADITVVPSIDKVFVEPEKATVTIGETENFDAKGIYYGTDGVEGGTGDAADVGPFPVTANWSIEKKEKKGKKEQEEIGSVNPTSGSSTTFTAVDELPEGKKKLDGKVLASVSGVEKPGNAKVTVRYLVDKIIVEPKEATVIVGGSQSFTAKAYDKDGNPVTVTAQIANEITWRVGKKEKEKEKEKKKIGEVEPGPGSSTIFTAIGVDEFPEGKKELKDDIVASYKEGVVEGKAKVTVIIFEVELKEVSFSGVKYHTVKSDDGSTDYTAPHWQDNSSPLDGDADDVGDKKYPVAFTRDTKFKISAKFDTGVELPSGLAIKIKGDGPGNLNIPKTDATYSGTTITLPVTEAKKAFKNKVGFFDTLDIVWKVSLDGGATWTDAGTSKNQAYITLGDPLTTVYHTLAHIGCKNADGKNKPDKVTKEIWSEFTDRDVKRVDGVQLTYYNSYKCSNVTTASLLENGDGQCGAWARFFIDTRKVQGIDDSDEYVIFRPINADGFIVKVWTFTGFGSSGHATFPYLNIPDTPFISTDSYRWKFAEVNDATGIPGQGNNNPASLFNNHQVVISGEYYDPSYGKKFSSLQEIDDNAIDGFYIGGSYPVDEQTVNLDLNGDGDKTDLAVNTVVVLLQKNPSGLDITETRLNY